MNLINQRPDEWELVASYPEFGEFVFNGIKGNAKGEGITIKCPCGGIGDEIYWKSSMFMPCEFSRFRHIPLLDIRCHRVQSISLADIQAEGIDDDRRTFNAPIQINKFKELWDSINGKRPLIVKFTGLIIPNAYAWKRNPWAFAYTFPAYNPSASLRVKENEK